MERALLEEGILEKDVGALLGGAYEGLDQSWAHQLQVGQEVLVWLSNRNLAGGQQQRRVMAGVLAKHHPEERQCTVNIPGELETPGVSLSFALFTALLSELVRAGLDWIGLACTGLDWIGLHCLEGWLAGWLPPELAGWLAARELSWLGHWVP